MVADRTGSRTGDNRGQLILVGAIAIALVLMGLVLVVNTALFTQVVGSEGTVETAKEGSVTADSIGESLAAVVAAENTNTSHSDWSDVSDNVTAVDGDLEDAFLDRSLEGGGSFTSLQYVGIAPGGSGGAVVQESVGTFEDASGNESWEVIRGKTEIGAFSMVIHDQSSLSSPFQVTINGSNGGTTHIEIAEQPSGDLDVTLSGAASDSCTGITPTDGTVRLDLYDGRVAEAPSCRFDAFGPLEAPYNVSFDDGHQVEGTWELVTAKFTLLTPTLDDWRFGNAADEPQTTPAIWEFEYSYTYDTPEATVTSDGHEVEVYD